ncbi:MAG: DoxX family protein [Mucilaginibacter sp.]
MKKVNIIYWIFTGLLILLMAFSAIGSFLPPSREAAAMMAQLGYPAYVVKMLAVAKILGIIALLVPGFPKIKEWAYAGFTFDLLGATISFIITGSSVMAWAPMLIWIAFIVLSYIYWHKKLKLQGLES